MMFHLRGKCGIFCSSMAIGMSLQMELDAKGNLNLETIWKFWNSKALEMHHTNERRIIL